MTSEITITNNPEANQYQARIGDELVGYAEYKLTPDLMVFTHTETLPNHEGQGVGSALAKFALDDVRREGTRKVLPLCPFIKAWIARHPQYIPLVYGVSEDIVKDQP